MENKFTALIIRVVKSRRFIIGAVVLLFLISFFTFSNFGLVKRFAVEIERDELKIKIQADKKTNDSLRLKINQLENSDFEIEKLAREKLGMIKPDEKVYIICQDSVKN